MSSIKEQVLAQQGQYKESDDKYLSVLKQYNCNLNDEEVAAAVKKILDEKVAENETMEVKKFLFGSIELTSLHTEDTEESILKMIEKVNQFAKDYPQLPHVATVCTEQVLAQQGQYKESDDKYLSVLKQYNCNLNDEEVAAAVKKILDEKVAENETMEVKKFLFGSIELTSLHTEDTEESILKMIEKVNQFAKDYPQLPHVATVCTYPNFAGLISQSLEVDGVEIAVVSGNFPSSQTFIEVKIAETAMAIKDGATEVDIVMPVGKFFSEDYEGLCDDIQELKETCGEHKMKCILETGNLKNCSNIMKASILAMYSGSDYIKTSTGKEKVSATPEAAYVMCQAIKAYYEKTGIQIGFKPAGGINTVHDAVVYYTIVKEVLGEKWLTNQWLRLGTSRLTNLLLSEILGKEIKYF